MSETRTPKLALPQIPEPCPAGWEAMQGDDRKRFCRSCGKHVHKLENLPADFVQGLLSGDGALCVQMRADRAGSLVTLPHSSRVWATRGVLLARRVRRLAAVLATLVMLPRLAGCVQGAITPRQLGAPLRPTTRTAEPTGVMGSVRDVPITRPVGGETTAK